MKSFIENISNLRKSLEAEPISWFSKTCYRDFFIVDDKGYRLAADKLSVLNLKAGLSAEEAMEEIKRLLKVYRGLPLWQQCWWYITRPMGLYQRLYELDYLPRLEVLVQHHPEQIKQEHENSFMKPTWWDILFENWRRRFNSRVAYFVEHTYPVYKSSWSSQISSAAVLNDSLQQLNEELEKKEYSLEAIVDCYERIDKYAIDEKKRTQLEKKIWLKIHPDKNRDCVDEATFQSKRFQSIKAEPCSSQNNNSFWVNQNEADELWKLIQLMKEERLKDIERMEARKKDKEEERKRLEELEARFKVLEEEVMTYFGCNIPKSSIDSDLRSNFPIRQMGPGR